MRYLKTSDKYHHLAKELLENEMHPEMYFCSGGPMVMENLPKALKRVYGMVLKETANMKGKGKGKVGKKKGC